MPKSFFPEMNPNRVYVNVAYPGASPKEIEEGQKKEKERIQAFEGIVISKHLDSAKIDSTVTVRKMFQGGGTEKVFLLNSPWSSITISIGKNTTSIFLKSSLN